jgi:hypothetical protein
LWGLSIGLFLNGEKKLTIPWQRDLSILIYEYGSEISILVYEHGSEISILVYEHGERSLPYHIVPYHAIIPYGQ